MCTRVLGLDLAGKNWGVWSENAVDIVHYFLIDVTAVMAMIAIELWRRSPCEFCNSVILVSTVGDPNLSNRCSLGTAVQHGDSGSFLGPPLILTNVDAG